MAFGLENSSRGYFANSRRETIIALGLALWMSVIFSLIFFLGKKSPTPVETWTIDIIMKYLVIYGLILVLPVLILLFIRKHSLVTISVQRNGLGTNIVVTFLLIFLSLIFTRLILYLFLIAPIIFFAWYFDDKLANSTNARKIKEILGYNQVKVMIFLISLSGIAMYLIFGGTIRTGEKALSTSAFIGLCAVLIQAGSEEIVFHGYFQYRAIDWLDEKKGILLTSAIFSIVHFTMLLAVGTTFPTIAVILMIMFITDIPIGYLTHKTRNLTGAILLHTVANLI